MRTTRPAARTVLVLIAASVALGSCSGASRMVNMWKDPAYPARPIDNALVVSISPNEMWRRVWEDAIVEELTANGVAATPSYTLFPSAAPDTQEVIDAVRSNDYAGVVVSRRLDVREVTHFVPGYLATVPAYPYGYWGRYYHPYYATVYRPGYAVTDTEVRYQIDVWSAEDGGKLVWMGTTASVNPSSYDQIRNEVSRLLVKELRMTGVVAGKGL
jgi:hypothetical protein